MDQITVYTKPDCVQCNGVFRALKKAEIDYRPIDVSTDPEAFDHIMSLGYRQVPVVVVGPDQHFGGFRPDRIAQLASAAAA